MPLHEYLLEFIRVGKQVKVTACDPESGREAVVLGPVSATRKELTDLAIKKLQYVLKKGKNPP